MNRRDDDPRVVLDLRTYKLKAGAGDVFAGVVRDEAVPMLRRFGIDVLAHGPSPDDPGLYYLVRSFSSRAERDERLAAFYGSPEWRQRHRDRVLNMIESYHVLLLPAEPMNALLA